MTHTPGLDGESRHRARVRKVLRCAAVVASAAILTPLGLFATSSAALADDALPAILTTSASPSQITSELPRTIVTQDGEIDDQDSFVRFLYYANEVDLEGIVYSSSRYHYRGDPEAGIPPYRWTGTEWVDDYIDDYEAIYPTLVQHDENYPTPDYLRSIYKIGNVDNVSEMTKDTEGSEFIEELILDDGAPIHVQTWGGLNTLARALKAIQDQYSGTPEWPALQARIGEKIVIYNILNQDATLADYIRPNWPSLRIIDNQSQFWSFAYRWARTVPQPFQSTLQQSFMRTNFLTNHGPLLAGYHTWGDGVAIPGEPPNEDRWSPTAEQNPQAQFPRSGRAMYDFISEGDSPSFLYLLDFNGLRQSESVTNGGWGGRFDETWLDTSDFNPYTNALDRSYPQTRWVQEIQNDWAARADWGVQNYADANHVPAASVAEGLDHTVYPGRTVELTGSATDPDGDPVSLSWWNYKEAGTYGGDVTFADDKAGRVSITIPDDAEVGDTIHLILDAKDNGAHTLVHHQRVILTVGDPAGENGIPVYADVPELGGGEEGSLTLSVANAEAGVRLEGPNNVGDRLRFDGQLPAVTVTDTRNAAQAGTAGWSVSGRATDLVAGAERLSASYLGWNPWAETLRPGVVLGDEVEGELRDGPGLATPARLLSADGEHRLGQATAKADLRLEVPVDTAEGEYEGRLTVTLFPVD